MGQGDPAVVSVGLLPPMTPGRPISRSRGVTPSSVAPECLGDLKSRAGTRDHLRVSVTYMRGASAVAGSMVAMTKPVSRDSKQKGPKESTDRALVNCAIGKYHDRPIQTHVPRHELGKLEHSKSPAASGLTVFICRQLV